MKRRTVQTYKILAVALTTAGCSSATGGEVAVKPAAETAVAVAPEPTSKDPALLALREELYAQKPDDALPTPARFQPLCDKDGYPLVGNVMRKTPRAGYQPSAFCAGVRAKVVAER